MRANVRACACVSVSVCPMCTRETARKYASISISLCECVCVSVCNWGLQVAYVLPIINNIFTVDMSAFFQSSNLIYIFSRTCFPFCTVTHDETHVWSPYL